jgi:hypothetical protein
MRVIYNNKIPFKGFIAMCFYPFILVRYDKKVLFDDTTTRHELIHANQQQEMYAVGTVIAAVLFIFGCGWWSLAALPLFFYWYVVEWLMRWAYYRNRDTAYKNISFEREAYNNQADINYLRTRKHYAFLKLL